MLWINERMLTEYDGSRHKEYDIHITRGDSGWVDLAVLEDGEPYALQEGDEIKLQVRAKPIKNDVETELVFTGDVDTSGAVPVWHISVADTTRNCNSYYWDVQLSTGDEVSTFACGKLFIEEEVTR